MFKDYADQNCRMYIAECMQFCAFWEQFFYLIFLKITCRWIWCGNLFNLAVECISIMARKKSRIQMMYFCKKVLFSQKNGEALDMNWWDIFSRRSGYMGQWPHFYSHRTLPSFLSHNTIRNYCLFYRRLHRHPFQPQPSPTSPPVPTTAAEAPPYTANMTTRGTHRLFDRKICAPSPKMI